MGDDEDGPSRALVALLQPLCSDAWVQCDHCLKWRRLPDTQEYEAGALPDQWFCHMNPNTRRNSCELPEERMGRGEHTEA